MCFDFFRAERKISLSLDISYFTFEGPTSLDSLYHCQYGGLFIEFVIGKIISICDKKQYHAVYGETENITILLVYFTGYSHGVFIGKITEEQCTARYLFWADNSEYNQIVRPSNFTACERIICPPRNNGTGHCKIKIRNEGAPIGVSSMYVSSFPTLRRCRGAYTDITTEYILNVSALNSLYWPVREYKIILKRSKTHKRLMTFFALDFIYFHFLEHVNISFPSICERKNHYDQFGLFFEVSRCIILPVRRTIRDIFILNKPQLSKECIGVNLKAFLHKITHYIYPVAVGEKNTGLQINVQYQNCPLNCRNYTYELIVLNKYQNTVYQYTSPVDSGMFTGYFNQGVRISVIPPSNPCTHISGCQILVHFTPPQFQAGVSNGALGFRIFSKRYVYRPPNYVLNIRYNH